MHYRLGNVLKVEMRHRYGTECAYSQSAFMLDFRMTFQEHTNAHEHTPHTNACTSIKNS